MVWFCTMGGRNIPPPLCVSLRRIPIIKAPRRLLFFFSRAALIPFPNHRVSLLMVKSIKQATSNSTHAEAYFVNRQIRHFTGTILKMPWALVCSWGGLSQRPLLADGGGPLLMNIRLPSRSPRRVRSAGPLSVMPPTSFQVTGTSDQSTPAAGPGVCTL